MRKLLFGWMILGSFVFYACYDDDDDWESPVCMFKDLRCDGGNIVECKKGQLQTVQTCEDNHICQNAACVQEKPLGSACDPQTFASYCGEDNKIIECDWATRKIVTQRCDQGTLCYQNFLKTDCFEPCAYTGSFTTGCNYYYDIDGNKVETNTINLRLCVDTNVGLIEVNEEFNCEHGCQRSEIDDEYSSGYACLELSEHEGQSCDVETYASQCITPQIGLFCNTQGLVESISCKKEAEDKGIPYLCTEDAGLNAVYCKPR